MMKKLIIIFICIMAIMSCNDNSKLIEEIALFRKKPVILPDQSELITCSTSKMNFNSGRQSFKYIIYNDTLGCSSCAINKMYLWYSLIEYAKAYNGQLKYYFIYFPSKKDSKNVRLILKNGNFDYPILLDTLGEFEKLNPHLPKNKALHTFLLDENNNVILVGNPVNNKKIKELFYKIVEEKLGKPQEQPVKDSLN